MESKKHPKASGTFAAVAVFILLMAVACSSSHDAPQSTPVASEITPTPTTTWSAMLQRTPYPYTTPLPPANGTILDDTYVKLDPRPGERAPCRRCPPYPPEGGVWRLHLDKGIFRVSHDGTGWATVGSFVVSGDQISFFNDPHCYEDVGIYTWELEDGELALEVIEDDCAFGLREENFVAHPWESCQPPSTEAAITNHWPTPVGCDMPQTP